MHHELHTQDTFLEYPGISFAYLSESREVAHMTSLFILTLSAMLLLEVTTCHRDFTSESHAVSMLPSIAPLISTVH